MLSCDGWCVSYVCRMVIRSSPPTCMQPSSRPGKSTHTHTPTHTHTRARAHGHTCTCSVYPVLVPFVLTQVSGWHALCVASHATGVEARCWSDVRSKRWDPYYQSPQRSPGCSVSCVCGTCMPLRCSPSVSACCRRAPSHHPIIIHRVASVFVTDCDLVVVHGVSRLTFVCRVQSLMDQCFELALNSGAALVDQGDLVAAEERLREAEGEPIYRLACQCAGNIIVFWLVAVCACYSYCVEILFRDFVCCVVCAHGQDVNQCIKDPCTCD